MKADRVLLAPLLASRKDERRWQNIFFDERMSFRLVGCFDPRRLDLPIVFLAREVLVEAERTIRGQEGVADYAYLVGHKHDGRFFVLDELIYRKVDRGVESLLGVVRLGDVSDWSPSMTGFALCFPKQPGGFLDRAGTPGEQYHPMMGFGPDEDHQVQTLSGFFVYEKTEKILPESPRTHEVEGGFTSSKRAIRVEVPAHNHSHRRAPARNLRTTASSPYPTVEMQDAAPGHSHRPHRSESSAGPIRVQPRRTRTRVRPEGQVVEGLDADQKETPDFSKTIRWSLEDYPRGLVAEEPREGKRYEGRLRFIVPKELGDRLPPGTEIFGKMSLHRALSEKEQAIELWLTGFAGSCGPFGKLCETVEEILRKLGQDYWPGLLWLRRSALKPEVSQRKLESRRLEVEEVAEGMRRELGRIKNSMPSSKRSWLFLTDASVYVYDSYEGKWVQAYDWRVERGDDGSVAFTTI